MKGKWVTANRFESDDFGPFGLHLTICLKDGKTEAYLTANPADGIRITADELAELAGKSDGTAEWFADAARTVRNATPTRIEPETEEREPSPASRPWATTDITEYNSGDLVPDGYEHTTAFVGDVPLDDDGATVRIETFLSEGPAGTMATTDVATNFEGCGVESAYVVAAGYALAAATIQNDSTPPTLEQVRAFAGRLRELAKTGVKE